MTQATWYTKQGTVKALRKSSDSCWPLRTAWGDTWADRSRERGELTQYVETIHSPGLQLVNLLGPVPPYLSSPATVTRLRAGVLRK